MFVFSVFFSLSFFSSFLLQLLLWYHIIHNTQLFSCTLAPPIETKNSRPSAISLNNNISIVKSNHCFNYFFFRNAFWDFLLNVCVFVLLFYFLMKNSLSVGFQKEMNAFQCCLLENRIDFDEVCLMCACWEKENKSNNNKKYWADKLKCLTNAPVINSFIW